MLWLVVSGESSKTAVWYFCHYVGVSVRCVTLEGRGVTMLGCDLGREGGYYVGVSVRCDLGWEGGYYVGGFC